MNHNNPPPSLALSLSLLNGRNKPIETVWLRWAGQAARMGDVRSVSLYKIQYPLAQRGFHYTPNKMYPPPHPQKKWHKNSLSVVNLEGQNVQK